MVETPIIVVLLGPPGAGKGTQGKLLSQRTGLQHVSTGAMLRAAVDSGTDAGRLAESHLSSGELVPDWLVTQLVKEHLTDRGLHDMCFDGFPRTRLQAEVLDGVLDQLNTRLTCVLLIEVSDEEALRRLMGRSRSDDSRETARRRISVYHDLTEPLVNYYHERGVLFRVDGEAGIDAVASSIDGLLVRGH